jgi:hypothetical protein
MRLGIHNFDYYSYFASIKQIIMIIDHLGLFNTL